MPVVFSPGEAETRPLNPEEIVYTTAQKVADLLGIGPQEAVLMSASAEANAVFVTGADFRNIGFSVSDILLIYSDADPMGQEVTVTAITSTTSGVKLTFTVNEDGVSSINPGLYETTDNGFVQNTASFTNGKTRGVKKSHVEQRIKEIQDRIDNITHNAWRPTLVSAEYINFDTYKPYRRRYYVDYVVSTPLLYRNVQQMLRIELWQGDDYREICSAEARLEIVDEEGLSGDSVYIGMTNGSVATLSVGTGSTNWRADFDKVSTAQNLADLINKEDRVSKATVEFSPTFTLEGSSSNIGVHNEILATANSDYGNGKLKITSLRQAKGGENVMIASTDLTNLTISQNGSRSTKTANGYFSTALTGVNNYVEVASYPPADTQMIVQGFLSSSTIIVLKSTAPDPSTIFTTGQVVYNENRQEVGTISSVGGGAGAYQIVFTAAVTNISTTEQLYDFKKVNTVNTDVSNFSPVSNLGYLASDSSPIYLADGTIYGTVVAAADTGSATITFSSPVTKLATNTKLYNRKVIKVTGSASHTFTAGETIHQSDGTLLGTFASTETTAHATLFRLSDTSTVVPVYTDLLYHEAVRDDTSSTTITVSETSNFPSKGILMIVNGASTRVFTYTGKTATTFTGVAVLGGGAALTQFDTVGTDVTQYHLKSDIGAFSDAGGDQARLKDWWIDYEIGMIYFNNSYPFFEHNAVKVSYIYGERYLEKAIEEAATKMVAVDLLMADDRSVLIPEGSQNVPLAQKIQMFKEEANSLLNRYKEMVLFE